MNQVYIYVYPLFILFFSHIGHYRVLSRVPCAIQQVLISNLFYIVKCVHMHIFSFIHLFFIMAIIYNAVMSIGVQLSFQISLFFLQINIREYL